MNTFTQVSYVSHRTRLPGTVEAADADQSINLQFYSLAIVRQECVPASARSFDRWRFYLAERFTRLFEQSHRIDGHVAHWKLTVELVSHGDRQTDRQR